MDDFGLVYDLLLVFVAAIVVVLLVARLKLPSIAGFILAGAIIGPNAAGLVGDVHAVEYLSEIGVVLLLFGVGLELPLERARALLVPMVLGGGLQMLITGVCVFGLARAFDMSVPAAVATSFLVAPSSTAIVLRGLSVRGQLEAPHGRAMLGMLLFQDLCVVPMVLVLPLLGGTVEAAFWAPLGRSLALVFAIAAVGALVVPRFLHVVAMVRERDVFVLAVLVICVGGAWTMWLAGASLALGAFLAGVVVALSPYRHQAQSELIPLREVLASLFFVSIGMLFDPALLLTRPALLLGILAGLLVLKALVVVGVAAALRLSLRSAVLAGVGMAQLGEFSLVLFRTVDERRLLEADFASALLGAAIASMLITPVLIANASSIAAAAAKIPGLARVFGAHAESAAGGPQHEGHVIIAGYGVAGRMLAQDLAHEGVPVVVVDLNPSTVKQALAEGHGAYFGDVTHGDVLEHLGVRTAAALVLLINDPDALQRALSATRARVPQLLVVVRSRYQAEVPLLRALGAAEVVVSEIEAGAALVQRVRACVKLTQDPPLP